MDGSVFSSAHSTVGITFTIWKNNLIRQRNGFEKQLQNLPQLDIDPVPPERASKTVENVWEELKAESLASMF